jgi:prevent-host-death family protein
MHRQAPGIEALVIGVPLGCGVDPALMQAKARAALALARRAHPLCRIGSAGFAGPTGTSFESLHDNKCNMFRLLWHFFDRNAIDLSERQPGVKRSFLYRTVLSSGCYRVLQCATVRFMKIRTITQRELRNQSAAVLREVEAGRTIIVSRNGTPVGELRPIKRRRFVPRATIADAAEKAARIDAAQFRADLDAVVDPHTYD